MTKKSYTLEIDEGRNGVLQMMMAVLEEEFKRTPELVDFFKKEGLAVPLLEMQAERRKKVHAADMCKDPECTYDEEAHEQDVKSIEKDLRELAMMARPSSTEELHNFLQFGKKSS